jgi:hypothetical protein
MTTIRPRPDCPVTRTIARRRPSAAWRRGSSALGSGGSTARDRRTKTRQIGAGLASSIAYSFYGVSSGVYYTRARGFCLREVFVPTLADLSPIKRLFSKGDNRASGEGDAP